MMPVTSSRKRKRTATNVPRKRTARRRLFQRKSRRAGTSGYLRLVRASNNDTTANVHLNIVGNNLIPSQDGATTFKLDNVAGVGELKSLFDNFRITKVLYRWVLVRDPTALGAAGSLGVGVYPRVNWVHDFNDAASISRTQMMQHAGMREYWFSESRQATKWFTLKCSSLVTQFEAGTASAYKPVWGSWVDTADSAMAHYGIKYCTDNMYGGNNLYLEAKLVIECKGIS